MFVGLESMIMKLEERGLESRTKLMLMLLMETVDVEYAIS